MTNPPDPPKVLARLFKNGRSQAVRLPKTMRFEGSEVLIWKEGERVILEPVPRRAWPEGYWLRWDALSEDLSGAECDEMAPSFLDVGPL